MRQWIGCADAAMSGKVSGTSQFDFIPLDSNRDGGIHLLRQFTVRAFHLHIAAVNRAGDASGKDYRCFTNS